MLLVRWVPLMSSRLHCRFPAITAESGPGLRVRRRQRERSGGEEASVRTANRALTIDVVGTGDGVIVGMEEARGSALQHVLSLAVAAQPGPDWDGLR